MPTGFETHPCRRPIAVIAAWLVVLQAFLAGLATAHAGVLGSAISVDAAAICHGTGNAGSTDRTAPDADRAWHLCCGYCTTAASAKAPVGAPAPVEWEPGRGARLAFSAFTIVPSPGVVRAGLSQAPPASV